MASDQQQRQAEPWTQPKPNYGNEAAQREDLLPKPRKELPSGPKTIGDALQEASEKAQDKPLEIKDARVIQSAEARATGVPGGILGGPSAYTANLINAPKGNPTLGDALADVKEYMPLDKVVTCRDAQRITQVETRNDPMGEVTPCGVASCIQDAAKYNLENNFIPEEPSQGDTSEGGREQGQPLDR